MDGPGALRRTQGRAMKCSICGTESKADAKQCANCGATLIAPKADQTMLDLRTAVFKRPSIVPAASPTTPARAAPPVDVPRPRQPNLGALALVIVALGTIGYFIYLVAITFNAPSRKAVSAAPPTLPQTVLETPKPAPPPVATLVPLPPPLQEPTRTATEPGPTPPKLARAPIPARSAPRSAAPTASPVAAAVPAPDPSAPAQDPAPVAVPVAVMTLAVEPPVPDRWQQMSDARADCARENLVGRIVCEQKVLFQYCNGYWGKVAQCPDASNPDRSK